MPAKYHPMRGTSGFTLVEVLVTMAILSVLVIFVGQIFNQSTRAVSSGSRSVEGAADARTVLDFLARELSVAVTHSNAFFRLEREYRATVYGRSDSRLFFASLSQQPQHRSSSSDDTRAVREVSYTVSPARTDSQPGYTVRWHDLMRGERIRVGVLGGVNPPAANIPLTRYVTRFDAVAYVLDEGVPQPWDRPEPYDSRDYDHALPLFVDLFLHSMTEEDIRRASQLNNPLDFVERHERRFVRRVYFVNRDGYILDPE